MHSTILSDRPEKTPKKMFPTILHDTHVAQAECLSGGGVIVAGFWKTLFDGSSLITQDDE